MRLCTPSAAAIAIPVELIARGDTADEDDTSSEDEDPRCSTTHGHDAKSST